MTKTHNEPAVRDVFARHGIDLVLAVPCKYVATLLEEVAEDDRFNLVYPSREEEGLGIAAGAWLTGRKPIMVLQNSGLGTVVNAYCSLNQYYDIPACFLITHRGDEVEPVAAQVPMGTITPPLLDLMKIHTVCLRGASDLNALEAGLRRYTVGGQSVAFLSKKSFWTV